MKHSTKVTALGASLATTLAVVVGAVVFRGDDPGTTTLAQRSAAVVTTTTSIVAGVPTIPTTMAPTTAEPVDEDAPDAPGPTTPPATAAPTVNTTTPAVNTTTPPAALTTTTTVAPTWTVRYKDGHTEVLTSAPPSERYNYRVGADDVGTPRHMWEEIICEIAGPPYQCAEQTGYLYDI